MTDNNDKPKKLTLNKLTLSLQRPVTLPKKTFVQSQSSSTIVEIKDSKKRSAPLQQKDSLHGNVEQNQRLNILKNVLNKAQTEDHTTKLSTLTELAAINKKHDKVDDQDSLVDENQEVVAASADTNDNKQNALQSENKQAIDTGTSHDNSNKTKINNVERTKPIEDKPVKSKFQSSKKIKKSDILQMFDTDAEDAKQFRTAALVTRKRNREKEKRKAEIFQVKKEKIYREVIIPEFISVGELASRMSERSTDVIKELMKLNVIANTSQLIDADTADIVVTTLGHTVKRVLESDIENVLIAHGDVKDTISRAPVVTVMGHVDHGKTSLLDALKSTDIASTEAGGITQHIGAYKVTLADGRSITFVDTPGHEAFTDMRMRGAQVTDIVVLVVAADDGIKTQTIEAINHAKAANVPIIVAINKIDKPDVNIDNVKNELLMHNLVSEELGGDTIIVPVSALQKTNLDKLEDAILLLAEMQELKANTTQLAAGVVMESRINTSQGVSVSILVQQGTLKTGDIMIAGNCYGKIKKIKNDKRQIVDSAVISDPVEVYGFNDAPEAGAKFNVVNNEKQAREITEYRFRKNKEQKIAVAKKISLNDLFDKASGHASNRELNIIIKGDVQGSVAAIITNLLKLPNDELKLNVLHSGVGQVNESDISLASASKAMIVAFNVKASFNAVNAAEQSNIEIKYYSVIYHLIDDIQSMIHGMLEPIKREQFLGSASIREVFNVSKFGKIAGIYVTKGVIKSGSLVRLIRGGIIIHEGPLKTLKRFKNDVKEVKEGFECGVALENYHDIKVEDTIECFKIIEEQRQKL